MLSWTDNPLRPLYYQIGLAVWLAATSISFAQAPAPAQFDPSDVYFQGYLATRAAEKLEKEENFLAAKEKLQQAQKIVEAIQKNYPAWKPDMVTNRAAKNLESLTRVHPKAEEQRKKNQSVIAEFEGGQRTPGTLGDPATDILPPTSSILDANPLDARRIAEAEAEVQRLRNLNAAPSPDPNESRNESRIRDIVRQRDLSQAQLKAAEANLQSLRARLATSPVENEMKSLGKRIAELEQERLAMGSALTQSRTSHIEALARTATLETDLRIMQQKHADLDRDLKAERKISNSVVAGQRTQLRELEKQLDQKNGELAKANSTITNLMKQLEESNAAFSDLREQRDGLLIERDQMSALLKLNEAGRIQELIDQNMGLAKNLREANDKVKLLNEDNNAAKDDITDALRDLAIAKSQIIKLHQEKRDQDERLKSLEIRLKDEQSALAQGKTSADPAEVEILRDIIQRQLRVQERRRQARDLMIAAAKELSTKDEKLAEAVKLFDSQEVQLTPDEQRLLADKNVDGEFISPFAQDRSTVGRNTTELNQDIAIFERTATKAILSGRLMPARELLQMVIEEHPGRISALCMLGLVNLKLDDPNSAVDTFRRAGELDSNNPYARRMLGFSLMTVGDLTNAEAELKEAIKLAPSDANTYAALGILTYRLGRYGEAESYFKSAIAVDPMPSDPHYNLALLCARDKRFEFARTHYQKALELGAIPDPKLEQRLAQP